MPKRNYHGRSFNRETTYICGDYADGVIYPMWQAPGKRRAKCKPTSQVQEKLNQRNAEKRLTRTVHANFTQKDLALHLTYRDGTEPANEKEALRCLQNFIRRLKRRYKKAGIELKYVSCTEYGETTGRVHHHMILSGGVDRDEIERLWGSGYANSKRLQFGQDGVNGLTHYMTKSKHFYKRWNQSKNLIIPEPIQRDGALNMEEVELLAGAVEAGTAHDWFEDRYPGFELVEAAVEHNAVNRGKYIRFQMRRKQKTPQKRT